MLNSRKGWMLMFSMLAFGAAMAPSCRADIVGGDDVESTDPVSKSTVALYRQTAAGGMLCTATLIAKGYAVTAAHCVEEGIDHMVVVFGTDLHEDGQDAVHVVGADVSPEWQSRHGKDQDTGDIALIRMDGKFPKGFHKASFLPKSVHLKEGDEVLLAGYGISNAFKKTGAGVLRQATVSVEQPEFGKTEILLNQKKGSGACHGDSGGPAFVEHNGKYYLMGVTSRGYPQTAPDDCKHEVVYTRVQAYRDWISKTMRANAVQ